MCRHLPNDGARQALQLFRRCLNNLKLFVSPLHHGGSRFPGLTTSVCCPSRIRVLVTSTSPSLCAGGWSVRQLDRQVSTLYFERSGGKRHLLSTDPADPVDEVKDPFVLEFLGLKDEYSESELEERLIQSLESFLLELGGDFAFVGRQRRLRVGEEWYRVDLLFYNRRLRCLVVIDLKLGKFTHADAGQMHLYLNYAREHWCLPGENPPVGVILCTSKDASVARYVLEGLPNRILAAEYRTRMPRVSDLAARLRSAHVEALRRPQKS